MIAHVDADSFFASVLVRKEPRLRGKPLLALGMGERGFVIAATYEAKARGVKTGMRVKDALALCPQALQIPSDFRETGIASHEIEAVLQDQCPAIEQMSVDEWYLDLQSIPGGEPTDLGAWAKKLQSEILRKTALSVSIGVGPSKLLAKMAGEYRKPGGITVLQNPETRNQKPETKNGVLMTIEVFLRDRPAVAIPGIGHARQIHAEAHGWKTAWDVAHANPILIQKLFGRPGPEMQRELLGESVHPIVTEPQPQKSISRARSFRATSDQTIIWAHVLRHLEYTVLKMRRQGLACRGITVWIRDQEYAFRSEHRKLPQAMDTETQVKPYVEDCFTCLVGAQHRGAVPLQKWTQTGLALWNLNSMTGDIQFSLFEDPERTSRDQCIQEALDALHGRYGRQSITRAASLHVKSGTHIGFDFTEL